MSFDRGQKPAIAVFDKSLAGVPDLAGLTKALQRYVRHCVVPFWGTPARLVQSDDFMPGAWALVFLDNADQAGALAYHDLTPDGLPISKVFVETILRDRASVSVAASHELVEMLVDPAINLFSLGPNNFTDLWAYEAADPVEGEDVAFDVMGFQMSDFVTPAWFEGFHEPGHTRFDFAQRVSQPFELLPGGHQIILSGGQWSNVFGSAEKAAAFANEDRRGHRGEIRKGTRT